MGEGVGDEQERVVRRLRSIRWLAVCYVLVVTLSVLFGFGFVLFCFLGVLVCLIFMSCILLVSF